MDSGAEVFLLEHVHSLPDGEDSVKTIGIYSTRGAAEKAIERLKRQPGFCDTPDGFCIDIYILDMDGWSDGFVTIVHHDADGSQELDESERAQ
jgi:hypothetical protein